MPSSEPSSIIHSNIPAWLDSLPWSRWHWRVVIALGITWILDGLEVTVVGALSGVLQRQDTLGLSAVEIGLSGSSYIGGAVLGALYFGHQSDRLGRKRLFLITLKVYLVATILTALSFDFVSFAACRFLTGFGIGGEYAAVNSAIDELIPARVRGVTDLAINGSFWLGAALGAVLSLVLLDSAVFGPQLGWRMAFALGTVLSVAILLVRRHVPESPRWLLIHGREAEANSVIAEISAAVSDEHGPLPAVTRTIAIRKRAPLVWREIRDVLLHTYPQRTMLGFSLMVAQAFFYNAIFFTYALVLHDFYAVPQERVGLYLLPFAVGNFLGPILLGPLFDSLGRRVMIAATYAISAFGLLATGYAFSHDWLSAATQTACWTAVFFFASAAASSAYLTVSEIFPVELRAVAISIFYAIGTGTGGFLAPALLGALIATHSRTAIFTGYGLGAALMLLAAICALRFAVDAERKSLEDIAEPLSAAAPETTPSGASPS